MTTSAQQQILEQAIGRLRDEGYEVFTNPRPPIAPAFLSGFVPDAIALGRDKNIVLEVSEADRTSPRLKEVAAIVREQPNWELRMLWIDPVAAANALPVQSRPIIDRSIGEIVRLRREGLNQASFLLGWATLEALSRAIETDEFARPQTPGRLVEILGREGYVGPSVANALRRLSEKRNRLVHGVLDAEVTAADVDLLLGVLSGLVERVAA